MVVDELVAILGYEVRGQDKLRAFTQSIDEAARRLATFAAAAATVAAGAMAVFGRSVIQTSAKFESFQATLETIEGSAEKARKSLDWVTDFATRTPYDVGEVTEAFIRMRAYGLDPTNGSLTAVGDAASAMGRSIMDGVEAIADATTGENERLKAFGITTEVAGKKITYTWRENGKEFKKTLDKNGVEIAKFLSENFERRFGGAMDKQSKTWNGMVANLGDVWEGFQRRIGDAGFFDAVKGQLARLMRFLDQLAIDGTLDRWATSWSQAFIWITDLIARFGWRMAAHWGTIAEIIEQHKGTWEWLKGILFAVAIRLWPLGAALFAAAIVLDDFLGYMRGGKSAIGDFIDALADFLNADPEKVADVLGKIATAAGGLLAASIGVAMFAGALRSLASALGLMGGAGAAAGAATVGRLSAVGKLGLGAAGIWGLIELLKGGKEHILSDPEEAAKATPEANKARVKARGDAIRGWWSSLFGGSDGSTGANDDGGRQSSLDGFLNFQNNMAKVGGEAAAQTVINDNADRSINVKATATVSVNEVNQAAAAAGRETENAVRNALTTKPRLLNKGMY